MMFLLILGFILRLSSTHSWLFGVSLLCGIFSSTLIAAEHPSSFGKAKTGLAMHKNCTPDVDLSLNDALNYLRKERISAPSNADNKWMTVGFEQIALGWVKQIPGRWNNYYPQHYRLRN